MKSLNFTHEHLLNQAQFTKKDTDRIFQCRRQHNRLGFGYQIAFVRLANRFPIQQPFEIVTEILTYVSVQLSIPSTAIGVYSKRQATISDHQDAIRKFLHLSRFAGKKTRETVRKFVFDTACRLEQAGALIAKTEQYLKEKRILLPSDDTMRRLVATQREEAKQSIYIRIENSLSKENKQPLDALLETWESRTSGIQILKQAPGRPSPTAMLRLTKNIDEIQKTGVLDLDLSWLNNNFQRALSRYAKRCTASRLRKLEETHRHAVLVCFLWQTYRDTVDFMVDMYDKLINRIYNHAQNDIDNHNKSQRKQIRQSLNTFAIMADLVLDESVTDSDLRSELYLRVEREKLEYQMAEVSVWLKGKHSHVFNLVKDRFGYIRQFSPMLLKHLQLMSENETDAGVIKAMDVLRVLNENHKRKLPNNAPMEFIPKKILYLVESDGVVNKAAWECALLTAIRDEIKSGNVSVHSSKRFGRLDDFFIPEESWATKRESFFRRAGLPSDKSTVAAFLARTLNDAYEDFLKALPRNAFASVTDDGWHLSSDGAEKLDHESETKLESLKSWLGENMRLIKLPELLIEVDNELKITRTFMPTSQQDGTNPEEICTILATIMAHGCNIGPYTMSHLTGISYGRIKHVTDWMITEDNLRGALAQVVNAISNLDITQSWGTGKTSSSDGQRFALKHKVLQQTYSPKFNDFALEFYSFVADNYAPFYSLPIECTDRDAPFVLDGLLYNESDLELEEHYVDTHGYTENNFAAFAMLGKRFSPRIKGLHKQRIYRIDRDFDYGPLSSLVARSDRTIHMDWIVDQWDRIGHFYASLESGHSTASTAMKRLNGFSGKNHFYRANRELGRVFKSAHILQYMSDIALRRRTRRGLLKGEQLHGLARDLNYGKRGRISKRDLQEQRNSCSCLTLILASIIYWQAKEINRVVIECDPEKTGIDLKLVEHISPIAWENVILYGEYILNRDLVIIS